MDNSTKDYEVKIEPIILEADSQEEALEYANDYFKDKHFSVKTSEVTESSSHPKPIDWYNEEVREQVNKSAQAEEFILAYMTTTQAIDRDKALAVIGDLLEAEHEFTKLEGM